VSRSLYAAFFLAVLTGGICLSGCAGPHAFVHDGNADSVEISYAGNIDDATRIARDYCARYEKNARLHEAGIDLAAFDCVKR
jgi:hypothetical protein